MHKKEVDNSLENKKTQINDPYGVLGKIKELNESGRFVIFAPNHVAPESSIRRNLAMAEDYGPLKEALKQKGIVKNKVVFRGDMDLVPNTSVKRLLYNTHARLMHILSKAVVDGYPIHLNTADNKDAQKRNFRDVKDIVKGMKEENIVIYPYGNWFESWEQDFSKETAYNTKEGKFFESSSEDKIAQEVWHNSIKAGFAKLAKISKNPVVPVYVYRDESNQWQISFWDFILPEWDAISLVNSYLSEMQKLKNSFYKAL